eukprot:6650993-Alexandrium_andersonii.AAC.1
MAKISLCIACCYRWLQWSETRWCRVGKAARFYVRSLAVGVDGAVGIVLEDSFASKFNIHGHKRSVFAVRRYLAIASLAPVPAESCLLQLLICLLYTSPSPRD